MMSEWRPIDSAPRDGTRVLVCWPDGIGIAWWRENYRMKESQERTKKNFHLLSEEDKEWLERHPPAHFTGTIEWDNYEDAEPENQPTHWMPLPERPK